MESTNHPPPAEPSGAAQSPAQPPLRARFPFRIVFFVWLPVVVTTVLVTAILPESFCSTSRIRVERDHSDINGLAEHKATEAYDFYYVQTEFEVIQSELVLGKVVEALDLNNLWGRRYANGERLRTSESITLLKGRLDLRPVRNTSIIQIRAWSERADEAAKIANALAEAYRAWRVEQRAATISAGIRALEQAYEANAQKMQSLRAEVAELSAQPNLPSSSRLDEARTNLHELQGVGQTLFRRIATEKADLALPATQMVTVVDKAVQPARPARPNKPLNLCIGFLVGALGGLFLATLVYVLQWREIRRLIGGPRRPFPPPFRAFVHIPIALVVGLVAGYCCATPLSVSTMIVVPLAFLLGAGISTYVELANPAAHNAPPGTPPRP